MPNISSSIRLTKGQDGGVLLDVDKGAMFTLNSVGVRIMELLQEGQTTSSVVGQISQEFGASEREVKGDVDDFLRLLGEQGLLEDQRQADRDATI